jgi:RNA recognition motif-containing protein
VKEEEVKEEKKKEIKKNRNDLDGTIFVRNISYEMKEEEFFKFYEKFGSLRYAKIVK